MARDILFVVISDPDVPDDLVRLLELEGFRLLPGPDGLRVCRQDPLGGPGPQVALIVTPAEDRDPGSPFRAIYARVRREDLDGADGGGADAVERLLRRVLPPSDAAA
jgi:hypothetical protein